MNKITAIIGSFIVGVLTLGTSFVLSIILSFIVSSELATRLSFENFFSYAQLPVMLLSTILLILCPLVSVIVAVKTYKKLYNKEVETSNTEVLVEAQKPEPTKFPLLMVFRCIILGIFQAGVIFIVLYYVWNFMHFSDADPTAEELKNIAIGTRNIFFFSLLAVVRQIFIAYNKLEKIK